MGFSQSETRRSFVPQNIREPYEEERIMVDDEHEGLTVHGGELPEDRKTEEHKGEIDVAELDEEDIDNLREEDLTNLDENRLDEFEAEDGARRDRKIGEKITPVETTEIPEEELPRR